MQPIDLPAQLEKMKADWDRRARENPHYYVASRTEAWTEEEFFQSGRDLVAEQILSDMQNVCQGRNPKQMRVLEIGCGAGRVTRALAEVFGEVHAVDVSGEMVRLARRALAGLPNAFVYQNNGLDLSVVPPLDFDFAFSCIVFQHIPNLAVIESYVREVHRLLRPGALFKFQVQGDPEVESSPDDTWVGAAVTDEMAVEMGLRCGFDPRYRHGSGTQYFWLWYFRKG
jgi:SAM-dependent methyltransferase